MILPKLWEIWESNMNYSHTPVMLSEVLDFLEVGVGGKYIDCTLGGAGYTMAIAQKIGSQGEVLSLDLDDKALDNARQLIKSNQVSNIFLKRSNFKNITAAAQERWGKKVKVNGIVLDLGLSSFQLNDEARGFSFKSEKSLNMAFGPDVLLDTINIVNQYSLLDLTRIFREYGEEKRAYYLAKAIVARRQEKPIESAFELAELIKSKVPIKFRGKIHPATKVFQALRMETNQELENLQTVLPAATNLLISGGKLVVVSFHSGEDRIVKNFFRNSSVLKIITKRPIIANDSEKDLNPRSRSAKLRAAEKIL